MGDGSGRKEDANKPKFKADHPSEVILAYQANESVAVAIAHQIDQINTEMHKIN